jgi:LmbE family N-acetylglucosaminyl deacetylase
MTAGPPVAGTVLSVWAHPDDETYLAGGVMAACAASGSRVVCVSATAGEHGTDDPLTWPPRRLAARRRDEFATAMTILGVGEHEILGFEDGTLGDIDREDGVARVVRLIADVRPDAILTFGPDGMTYHADHIAVGEWVTEAWHRCGRPGRLLHATATTDHYAMFGPLYEAWQMYMTAQRPTGHVPTELALHVALEDEALERKLAALAAMESQTADLVRTLDAATWRAMNAEEAFVGALMHA